MNIVPFAQNLQAELPDEAANTFVLHMPETVQRGILLLHNLNGAKLYPSLPGYKKAKFQAIVRERDFQSGYDLAKQVMAALEVSRKVIGPLYVHHTTPLHDPVSFPVSKGDYIEFSVNFMTVYTEN